MHNDDPVHDRIDRSIVIGSWLKQVALWALRLLIIAVAAYALWFGLKQFWAGILPMVLALIVCTVLAGPTTWMRRRGLPSALAAIISVLLFFGVFGAVIAIIAPDIARQSQVLYLQALEGIQRLQLWSQGPPLNLNSEDVNQVVNDVASWIQGESEAIAGTVFSGISTATSLVITLFMVLVLVVFFLKDGHRFLPWLRSVMGRRAGWHATELLTRSWDTLGGYVRAQAIVSAVDAFFIALGLWLLDVPMAFTLGIITFIAGFIPYIGAFSAGALAVLIALVSQGVTTAVLALGVVLLVQQLEGNILSPLLQSRAMNLHPVIVLISVVVGGGLFGIVGAFLAVPAAATLAVAFRYIMDITMLQTGERNAADIDFFTPEGRATGKVNEERGRELRRQWREDSAFYAEAEREFSATGDSADAFAAVLTGEGRAPTDKPGQDASRRPGGRRVRRVVQAGRDSVERIIGGRRFR
nr:AI-2E family transporter [Corynebacterium guangdongense]